MGKYSNKFKLKVVNYYIKESVIFRCVANYFNIPSWTTVKKWVRKYEEHGVKGLIKNPKSSYSGEFKQELKKFSDSIFKI